MQSKEREKTPCARTAYTVVTTTCVIPILHSVRIVPNGTRHLAGSMLRICIRASQDRDWCVRGVGNYGGSQTRVLGESHAVGTKATGIYRTYNLREEACLNRKQAGASEIG